MSRVSGASLPIALCCLSASCMPALPEGVESNGQQTAGGEANRDGGCGSGSWLPGWLEIHHIDAGEAVSTLVVSPSGRSLLIDAGEAAWDDTRGAEVVGAYVRAVLGCAHLDYVLITHFHLDHVGFPGKGGLWNLVFKQGFTVGRLLHRDLFRNAGVEGTTLAAWRAFLRGEESRVLNPSVAVVGGGQVDLEGVAFAIAAVDGDGILRPGDFSTEDSPPDENDYSIAVLLRTGRLDYFTAGDLSGETLTAAQGGYSYHDLETHLAAVVKDVDVYRVSHHGSGHASNQTLLAQLAPRVSIVQVADGNEYGHPSQSTMDRLLARSAVYLTQRGEPDTDIGLGKVSGHVVLRTANGIDFTVNGDAFTASDPPRVDADGDGYFQEADPDDTSALVVPMANGGCDGYFQACR